MPEMLNLGLADPGAGRGNPAYELDLGRVLRQSFFGHLVHAEVDQLVSVFE